jgi:hypothetical protein
VFSEGGAHAGWCERPLRFSRLLTQVGVSEKQCSEGGAHTGWCKRPLRYSHSLTANRVSAPFANTPRTDSEGGAEFRDGGAKPNY